MQREKRTGNNEQGVGRPVEKEQRCWGRSRCVQGVPGKKPGVVVLGGGGSSAVLIQEELGELISKPCPGKSEGKGGMTRSLGKE